MTIERVVTVDKDQRQSNAHDQSRQSRQETRPPARVQRRFARAPEYSGAADEHAVETESPAPIPASTGTDLPAFDTPLVATRNGLVAPLADAPETHREQGTSTDDTAALEPAPHSSVFDLDWALLEKQGFVTPGTPDKRLALELRAIKRRLLRRMQFYRLDAEKRRRQSGRMRQRNTILFTSTRPAEGKTFTALNLALSLAIEDDINVLLIDADVPRPKVFQHLGLKPEYGLTDRILEPDLPVSELILRERNLPLSVMSQGLAKASPVEVFARDEMAMFIEEVSLRYPDRIVIFDAPPVLATPEAIVLARHVDEVVFVVEANETPEPAVATALDEILDNNSHVSLVLNKCKAPEAASHYGSYEEYYTKSGSTLSSGKRRSGKG